MVFKSYCWSVGTTSFRVEKLNYKNECQLRYLAELFKLYPNSKWKDRELQKKYFDLLVSKNFIKDYKTVIKDKDAREKTSGLADIGLVNRDREITPVGKRISEISKSEDFATDNIFYIPKDSYIYLLQLLKLQILDSDIKIKPFVALLYMLSKLDYLSREEFTYLLPICLNSKDVIETTSKIMTLRGKISVDELLIDKMMSMSNYQEAYNFFISSEIIDEIVMEKIGFNRKSAKYDRPFSKVFNLLVDLVLNKNILDVKEKIIKVNELRMVLKEVNKNQSRQWNRMLNLKEKTKINGEYLDKFYKLDICKSTNINELKDCFFKNWHLIKWKLTLNDYYDLNKRYFELTDIIRFENEHFEMTEIASLYFTDIIDDMFKREFIETKNYQSHFTNLIKLSDIYPECTKTEKEITQAIKKKYGIDIEIDKLEEYIQDKRNKELLEVIDKKFNKKILLELLECFKNRNDSRIKALVTDNADASTIFEYITGIIWYDVSEKKGKLIDYMRLSLDANYLPKQHAQGKGADLVFNYTDTEHYPAHDLLLEVTLSESTGQRQMEWEPVSRHLETHIVENSHKHDYVIFIASKLEERTMKTFRIMKNYNVNLNEEEKVNLKIIPTDINILSKIVEKDMKYKEIYKIFDESYNSTLLDQEWYDKTIANKF